MSLSIIGPKGKQLHIAFNMRVAETTLGKDIGLLNLVHDYIKANSLPTSVMTGRTAFCVA